MKEGRIIPAQSALPERTCTRYGMLIPNHPLGISRDSGSFKTGDYIASWETREQAEAAAYALGYDPYFPGYPAYGGVTPIGYLVPDTQDDRT